ncbi:MULTISPECIES: hypothetical protein [Elizabethkingia]|jgi:hypothetical protein|uniref:hypothetical protein n=1 Tax=Elizabethkingia TaxID=308865 RepID=UPI000B34F2D6|nr:MULTISPECIES: hypothetical protein [Elizabethkingia]
MNLIDKHYQHYLEKVQLKESDMSDVQKSETKKAFAAGMSSMIAVLIMGIKTPEEIEEYGEELMNFWNKEIYNYDENNRF